MTEKIKFSEAKIKGLPSPNSGREIYLDTETRGLGLRVTSSGVKTFFLRRKFKGRSERITLGRHPETSLTLAKKLAAECHLAMDAGKNPNDQKRAEKNELTLDQFFTLYFEQHIQSHNKRPEDTQSEYRRYIEKPLGNKRLSEISKSKLVELHAKLGREIGKRTANKVHTVIRALFNRAFEWGYYEGENPAKGIKRFKEEKRERFLSKDELKRFFIALETLTNITMRDFFLTLLFTGARSGEVRSMAWQDIDLQSGIWRLGKENTKNSESRIVVLPVPLVEILKNRFANNANDYVFSSHSKSGYLQEPKSAWKKILEKAEISDFRIHDLRHTWASWMVAEGVSLPVVQKALGHKDITSTAIYANTDLALVASEVEKTANKILEVKKNE